MQRLERVAKEMQCPDKDFLMAFHFQAKMQNGEQRGRKHKTIQLTVLYYKVPSKRYLVSPLLEHSLEDKIISDN